MQWCESKFIESNPDICLQNCNALVCCKWFDCTLTDFIHGTLTLSNTYFSATLFKQNNRCLTTIWTFCAWVTRPSWALKHFNKWYDLAEIRAWQFNCICLLHLTALFVLSALSSLFVLCVVCVCFCTLCTRLYNNNIKCTYLYLPLTSDLLQPEFQKQLVQRWTTFQQCTEDS